MIIGQEETTTTSDTSTATLLYPTTSSELCINGSVACVRAKKSPGVPGFVPALFLLQQFLQRQRLSCTTATDKVLFTSEAHRGLASFGHASVP